MSSNNERLNSFIFASDLFRKVKEANTTAENHVQ